MKLTYDPVRNIGYIAFRERPAQVETIHLSDELNVDIAPDGTLYGIELLNANEQLASGTIRTIVLENSATGTSSEVPLPV
ncbi:MAG: DUF2283 domain-containing protein [Candidatus Hydrogenedentes bacterium]|nr:DUF2283 domain-containing protein [Candidatus Hydrogenedentota bacterium]